MNPILRALLLGALSIGLGGCDPGVAVKKRMDDIKRENDRLDQKFSTRAAQLVRARWVVDGSAWYGKMEEGAVVRLESPVVEVKPLHVGRPFYTGWAGEVTVSSATWKSRPETRKRAVFSVKYRAIFKDLKTPEIEIAEGPRVARPTATDLVVFHAEQSAVAPPGGS